MKSLLFIVSLISSLSTFSQTLQKKISLQIDNHISTQNSPEFNDLKKKVNFAYRSAIKSLTEKHEFDYLDETENLANLILKIKISYNDRHKVSYGELFKYKTEIYFIASKTDSVVVKTEILYKDLVHIPNETLVIDSYNIFNKTLAKIAVPIEDISEPLIPETDTGCLCLKINYLVKSSNDKQGVATQITNILNNVIVFQQTRYSVVYHNNYRITKKIKSSTDCNELKGFLTSTPENYILTIQYPPSLNLTSPKDVKTKLYFAKHLIDDGDYYEAVWQLNKSIYEMLENNASIKKE